MANPFRIRSFFGEDPGQPRLRTNLLIPDAPNSTTSKVDNQDDNSYGSADIYNKLLSSPPPPAQRAYRDFLSNAPQRDDYKPSKLTKLSAMLAGISEGTRHGAGSGTAVQQNILDSGYNDAQNDWKLSADRMGKAADVEEKDISNRVKTYRDAMQDAINQRNNDRLAKLNAAQIDDYKSKISERQGKILHFAPSLDTGHLMGVKGNDKGGYDNIDFGFPAAKTDAQRLDFNKTNAGNISDIRMPNELKLARERGAQARETMKSKFSNIKDLIEFKGTQPNTKIESLSDGSLVIVDKNNNTVEYTGLNSGKLGDKEKQALGLGITKKSTVTISADGKEKKTEISTENKGSTVKVISPKGETGTMSAAEFEEAQKHGWKKVGS